MPIINSQLSHSLPCLHFFSLQLWSSVLSTLHLFSSLCVPPSLPNLGVTYWPHACFALLFFFHCSLCGVLFPLILNNVRVFEPAAPCRLMWAYFPKGSMFIILNTDYATLSFSFLSLSVCHLCVLFFVLVCLAGRGTCSHTPAVCRVAGPRRTGRPFRLPAVHQLGQGEEER